MDTFKVVKVDFTSSSEVVKPSWKEYYSSSDEFSARLVARGRSSESNSIFYVACNDISHLVVGYRKGEMV